MNLVISTIINLIILIALIYWNHRVETAGTEEEKWAHKQSIVATAKLLVFLALVGLGFDVFKTLCHIFGLIGEAPSLAPELTVSLIAVIVIYFCFFDYYKKPESERTNLRKRLHFFNNQ